MIWDAIAPIVTSVYCLPRILRFLLRSYKKYHIYFAVIDIWLNWTLNTINHDIFFQIVYIWPLLGSVSWWTHVNELHLMQNMWLDCKVIQWKIWSKCPNTIKPCSFKCSEGLDTCSRKHSYTLKVKKFNFSNRYILLVCALHVYRIYPNICNIHHFSPSLVLQYQYPSYVYGV